MATDSLPAAARLLEDSEARVLLLFFNHLILEVMENFRALPGVSTHDDLTACTVDDSRSIGPISGLMRYRLGGISSVASVRLYPRRARVVLPA